VRAAKCVNHFNLEALELSKLETRIFSRTLYYPDLPLTVYAIVNVLNLQHATLLQFSVFLSLCNNNCDGKCYIRTMKR